MSDMKAAREAARVAVSSLKSAGGHWPGDTGYDEFIANAAIDAFLFELETPELKDLNARVEFGVLKVGIDHGSGIDGECTLYSEGILIASGIETDNARFIAAAINVYRAMLKAAEQHTGEK